MSYTFRYQNSDMCVSSHMGDLELYVMGNIDVVIPPILSESEHDLK
jgi:hypothetical protein